MIDDTDLADAERIWTTESGQEIRWDAMTVGHLRNTAAYLRRRAAERNTVAEQKDRYAFSETSSWTAENEIALAREKGDDDIAEAEAMEAYADARSAKKEI